MVLRMKIDRKLVFTWWCDDDFSQDEDERPAITVCYHRQIILVKIVINITIVCDRITINSLAVRFHASQPFVSLLRTFHLQTTPPKLGRMISWPVIIPQTCLCLWRAWLRCRPMRIRSDSCRYLWFYFPKIFFGDLDPYAINKTTTNRKTQRLHCYRRIGARKRLDKDTSKPTGG